MKLKIPKIYDLGTLMIFSSPGLMVKIVWEPFDEFDDFNPNIKLNYEINEDSIIFFRPQCQAH